MSVKTPRKSTTPVPAPEPREKVKSEEEACLPKNSVLFVGYRTKAIPDVESMLPEPEQDRRLTDPEKIKIDLETKKAKLIEQASRQPYTGVIDAVFLCESSVNPIRPRMEYWDNNLRKPGDPPICVSIRNWFLSTFPDAWSRELGEKKYPTVILVGFDPRLFLKILGAECSMNGAPLPPNLWCQNSDHRDIVSAVIPHEFSKTLSLPFILQRYGLVAKEEWTSPGNNPKVDAMLAMELAARLGFITKSARSREDR